MRWSVFGAVLLFSCCAVAGAASREGFEACDDTAAFPELAGAQCLTARVPLRHAGPQGASIELAVRRFPAATGEQRGEVWLVAGGPGEPGASLYPLLDTFRRAFPGHALVIPDHRGTGGSTRLCPKEEALDSEDGVALAGSEWGSCIGAMHADAARTRAFSITEAAHDLSTLLQRHRGEGEVRVYAVSYGTQLVLRMLQVAPVMLDGLVLDGLVPPEDAPQWDLSRRTALVDEAGRAFLGSAAVAEYEQLLETTGDAPAWRSEIPGGDLRRFLGTLLNFPAERAAVPQIIRGLATDDTTALAATVASLRTTTARLGVYPLSPPSMPLVMLVAASENNSRPGLTAAVVEDEARTALFTSAIPGFLVDPVVPRYQRDTWYGRHPAALPRTLVVHGTLDPNTAYAGARAHVDALADAGDIRLSTVEGGAHLLAYVAPECFVAAASAFVQDDVVPTSCREDG